MNRPLQILAALLLVALAPTLLRADEPKKATDSGPKPGAKVSFIKDVAPILVQSCIACHNPRKSESKYTMTTFAQLAKGASRVRASPLSRVTRKPAGSLSYSSRAVNRKCLTNKTL
jgi:hypothetical protein